MQQRTAAVSASAAVGGRALACPSASTTDQHPRVR